MMMILQDLKAYLATRNCRGPMGENDPFIEIAESVRFLCARIEALEDAVRSRAIHDGK